MPPQVGFCLPLSGVCGCNLCSDDVVLFIRISWWMSSSLCRSRSRPSRVSWRTTEAVHSTCIWPLWENASLLWDGFLWWVWSSAPMSGYWCPPSDIAISSIVLPCRWAAFFRPLSFLISTILAVLDSSCHTGALGQLSFSELNIRLRRGCLWCWKEDGKRVEMF